MNVDQHLALKKTMNFCLRCVWRTKLRPSLRSVLLLGLTTSVFFNLAKIHLTLTYPPPPSIQGVHRESSKPPSTKDDKLFDLTTNKIQWDLHDDWMEVEDSERSFFLYSAYLDRRGRQNTIRIIAIGKKRKQAYECQLWLEQNKTERVKASIQPIRENWGLAYSATFILCPLPDTSVTPLRVAVMLKSKGGSTSSVAVEDLSTRRLVGNMSVCVKPFHYEYDRAIWLVEFIEFYRILGADQFIFYNHTVGRNVNAVLEYYKNLGVVAILPWTLPVISQKEIRTEGIFAALNDCNLRSVGRYTLTAMVDIDEYLIPRTHQDLLQLVADYGDKDNVYSFQNVFFYLYWENDTAVHDILFADQNGAGHSLFGEEAAMPYLLTAYKTHRLDKPQRQGQRSKYLVRPERVVEVGNHQVWEHVVSSDRGRVKAVPANVGLSHHYRICEFGGFDCLKQSNQKLQVTADHRNSPPSPKIHYNQILHQLREGALGRFDTSSKLQSPPGSSVGAHSLAGSITDASIPQGELCDPEPTPSSGSSSLATVTSTLPSPTSSFDCLPDQVWVHTHWLNRSWAPLYSLDPGESLINRPASGFNITLQPTPLVARPSTSSSRHPTPVRPPALQHPPLMSFVCMPPRQLPHNSQPRRGAALISDALAHSHHQRWNQPRPQ